MLKSVSRQVYGVLGVAVTAVVVSLYGFCVLVPDLIGAAFYFAPAALIAVVTHEGIRTLRERGSRASPHRDLLPLCDRCGYSLRGLSGDRCPECGHLFDPSRLARGGWIRKRDR